MRPTWFTIKRTGPGRLSTMTRPRGGDWLAGELQDLALAGVKVLVSLLSDGEVAELGLAQEGTGTAVHRRCSHRAASLVSWP